MVEIQALSDATGGNSYEAAIHVVSSLGDGDCRLEAFENVEITPKGSLVEQLKSPPRQDQVEDEEF